MYGRATEVAQKPGLPSTAFPLHLFVENETSLLKSRVFLVSNTQNVWEIHGRFFNPVF